MMSQRPTAGPWGHRQWLARSLHSRHRAGWPLKVATREVRGQAVDNPAASVSQWVSAVKRRSWLSLPSSKNC